MDPEDFSSFDRLLTPQYVTVVFYVGVAASVLLGLADLAAGLSAGSVSLMLWGLAMMIGGPVLVRIGCELLILAFKTVDWIAEINATLARQQQQLAEQADQRASRLDGDAGSSSGIDASSGDASSSSASPADASPGEPTLPSSR